MALACASGSRSQQEYDIHSHSIYFDKHIIHVCSIYVKRQFDFHCLVRMFNFFVLWLIYMRDTENCGPILSFSGSYPDRYAFLYFFINGRLYLQDENVNTKLN